MTDPFDPAAHDPTRAGDTRPDRARGAVDRSGTIEVIPRLSAPIDEGVFYPHPAPTLWDRAVRIAIFAVVIAIVVVAALSRGTFFLR